MRIRSIILALSAAALISCTIDNDIERAKVKAESDRKIAPDFTLKDASGQTVKLSDYRGKVVLLNFWATWCEPCQEEIPWFVDFQQSLKDRDFAVVGVSMDDDGWTAVKPFIAQNKINYRIVIGTEELSGKYGGIEALPTTFVLDRRGRIATVHLGLVSKNTYKNEILNLLDQARPSPSESVGEASPSTPPDSGQRGNRAASANGAAGPDRGRDIVPLVASYLRAK